LVKVLFDFKLMFENAKDNGLVDTWSKIQNIPFTRFGVRIEKGNFPVTRKNDDIFKMFTYINLIKTPRVTFKKAAENFLIYSEVNSDDDIYYSCVICTHVQIVSICFHLFH